MGYYTTHYLTHPLNLKHPFMCQIQTSIHQLKNKYFKPWLASLTSVQSHSCVRFFVTPWTVARQASLSITNSWNLLQLMSIELVMPSNHLILCLPFSSHLQSFPAAGSFQMSQFFTSGGQSSVSFSISPSNEYSGLISFRID